MVEARAARLRRARAAAGFKGPAEAVDRFGWSYPTYAGHENGSNGISRAGVAARYAKAFGVSEAWLLTGEGAGPQGDGVVADMVTACGQLAEITPAWIRRRAEVRGMSLGDLAEAIGIERTKLSKSLNGHRNFLASELVKLGELLGEATAGDMHDPEVRALVEDYLALSEPDRLRAREMLRGLLRAEALEADRTAPEPGRAVERHGW